MGTEKPSSSEKVNPYNKAFPDLKLYDFAGTPALVGEQHGEALKDKIKLHLDLVYSKSLKKSGLSRESLLSLATKFEPFIERYAPQFLEELKGISRSAGISYAEALLLQIRQEAINLRRLGVEKGSGEKESGEKECTTFAVSAPYTEKGAVFSGQNADLTGPFEDFSAVIRFRVKGKPVVQMLIPAGQVSYIGFNSEGISACANFLNCTGWRAGFPRYMLTRLALEERSFEKAKATLLTPERASSRNLMLTHREGDMIDLELAVTRYGVAPSVPGAVVHSNHFVCPDLKDLETSPPEELSNSIKRYDRMKEMVDSAKGSITLEKLKEFSKDHTNYPDSICAHAQYEEDSHTFASMIVDLKNLTMHVALGNPCQTEHQAFSM